MNKGTRTSAPVSTVAGLSVLVAVSPKTENFQPKLDEFEQKITAKTKAVIVNTPNNPTGVVYSEDMIKKLAAIMEAKQKEILQKMNILR